MELHKAESTYVSMILFMIAMMTGVSTWAALGLLVHLPITFLHFPVASLLTWGILLRLSQGTRFALGLGKGLLVLFLYANLVFGFAFVANLIWDFSVDGRWYHSEGIMQLVFGWNPIYDPLTDPHDTIYVQHYPKSQWLLAASLRALFGQLEMAKLVHFLLHGWVCALSPVFFKKAFAFTSYAMPILAGLVLAFHPIFLAQAFTFYNDADLAAGMIGVFFLFFFHSQAQGKDKIFLLGAAFPLLAYTAHIKFTGLLYLAFMLFFYLLLYAWKRRKEAFSLFAYLTVSLILIVGLIGFHPLITNTLEKGHPFYPLMGTDPVDIMEPNTPADLRDKNPWHTFFLATLADPAGNADWTVEIRPEAFFHLDDPATYGMADTRLRGFGLYSPLIFLLLIPALIAGLAFWRPRGQGAKAYVVYMVLVLLAIALISGQMWWARYIAYLWVLIPIALCALFRQRHSLAKLLALLLFTACLVNGVHFADAFFEVRVPAQAQVTRHISQDLAAPPENPDGTLESERYFRLYSYNYWYVDKIQTLGIQEIHPASLFPLSRTKSDQPLPQDFLDRIPLETP